MTLKWMGMIGKHNSLPSPVVPSGAKLLIDKEWPMYILIVPLLLLAYGCIVAKRPFVTGVLFTKGPLFFGVGVAVLFLVVHELIHALFCPRKSEILIYGAATGICMIPTCPLRKQRYIIVAIMPTILLGICPLVIWLILTDLAPLMSSALFAFSIGSLSMCIGDIYNVLLAARKMTSKSLLITSRNACYYYEE